MCEIMPLMETYLLLLNWFNEFAVFMLELSDDYYIILTPFVL